jgi:catechol 2,3-dioxygenase-like lactoylglutathione lyase family enzyme
MEHSDADDAGLTFKVADQSWEFEQIHRLNYRTFVDEIPQHAANDRHVLVDRFHDQNTYLIALRGRTLVAMVALRCQRPFSLDQKLGDVDRHLPAGWTRAAEIRLLASDKSHRGSRLFYRLLAVGAEYMARNGFDLAVISGTTRQLKLYRHLGFVPFGPLIGTPGAMYQPMYLTRDRFEAIARALRLPVSTATGAAAATHFLPGPVDVTASLRCEIGGAANACRTACGAIDNRRRGADNRGMSTDDRITVQRIEHVAVVVSDVERAKAFYGGVLGLTEVPRPESFDFAGAWYRNGPTDLHIITNPQADAKSRRHVAFYVADLDAAARVLETHGFPVRPEQKYKIRDIDRFFTEDPDGNRIEIMGPERR